MNETPPLVFVDIYKGKQRVAAKLSGRPQPWRWRAINGNNQRRMATGAEAYSNKQDCMDAITQLFGSGTNVYLRESETGDRALRMAVEQ